MPSLVADIFLIQPSPLLRPIYELKVWENMPIPKASIGQMATIKL